MCHFDERAINFLNISSKYLLYGENSPANILIDMDDNSKVLIMD